MHASGVRTVLCSLLLAAQGIPAIEASRAADFVNSIGVCTHWSYGDTPYGGNYDSVKALLRDVGIVNTRDGLYADRPQDLGSLGIRTTVVADPPNNTDAGESYITDLIARIKAANAAGALIDAVEGPNEPDLFWVNNNKRYKGQPFPAGVIAFQQDLYRLIKADPATAGLTVVGPSLGVTYDPGGGSPNPFAAGALTASVDLGNFHPYPGGNPFSFPEPYATIEKYYWFGSQPSGNIDEWPYALNTYAPPFAPKAMAATETGYSTFVNGVSETVHAKYLPRLFLEYFRKGVRRTYSYEFVDEWPDAGATNREAHFGLVRNDLTVKPAYLTMKNLIAVLRDPDASFEPESLGLVITVSVPSAHPDYTKTQFVHRVLLQKKNGRHFLAVWHEIANTDNSTTPPREIDQPAMPVSIALPSSIATVRRFSLNPSGILDSSVLPITGGSVALSVPDYVQILELTSAPSLTRRISRTQADRLRVEVRNGTSGIVCAGDTRATLALVSMRGACIYRTVAHLRSGWNPLPAVPQAAGCYVAQVRGLAGSMDVRRLNGPQKSR